MSHPVKLTLIDENEDEHKIEAELSEDEWDTLEAYLDYVEDLFSAKLARRGVSVSLRMDWDEETQELQVGADLPPEEDIIVLLHKLRPFILERESTHFMKVSSVLGKHLDNPYVRGMLKQARHLFDGRHLQSLFQVTANDEMLLNSDKALDLWLNAHEYHRDREYQENLKELTHMSTFDGARAIFLVLLIDKVKAIYMVASLVASVLGKEPRVKLYLMPSYLK